jgi:hypothetical protein
VPSLGVDLLEELVNRPPILRAAHAASSSSGTS